MWRSVQRQVAEMSSDLSTDWVLSYWAHPDGEAGLEAARACGAKAGVIVGGSDVLILTKDPQRKRSVQRVLNESDAIFTVSEGLRRHVISLGVDAAKVHTIYQGTNPATFSGGFKSLARQRLSIPTSDRVFLWVGRLVDVKRPSLLIEAFARVRAMQPSARLILAGDGPLLPDTQRLVEEADLTESVHFAGAVPQSELPLWYRAADATVLSSDSEGLPNVFRESLACGTPFVSTDVGSISEIASSEYSLLAHKGDAEDLSRAMLEILNVRFQLGVQNYKPRTWTDCAGELIDVMADVSSSAGRDASPLAAVDVRSTFDDLITADVGSSGSAIPQGAANATHDS
jgi:teichuronic acid biosynthesis glycosyltransferase TuaC